MKRKLGWKFRGVLSSFTRWLGGRSGSGPLLLTAPLEQAFDSPAIAPGSAFKPLSSAVISDEPPRPVIRTQADRRILAKAFDSSHPVRTRAELFGRERELQDLLAASLDFRQHSVVHGARGSGKTSLVRVFGDYADQNGVIVIYMACEPGVGFADLLRPYLRAIPAAALAPGMKDRFRQELAALPENFSPRTFVELVAETVSAPLVLIFDEFDRITDREVRSDISAAMKLLSDALSSVLFMLVGIARNVSDVVDGHPSLRRHMRTVALGRIEETSVDALIDGGATAAGLRFDAGARQLIARAACGSPFHVRMFCHHAALVALARNSQVVEAQDVRPGFKSAFEVWGSMNEADADIFMSLVRLRDRHGELERIARAAAISDSLPVTAQPQDVAALELLGQALGTEPAHGPGLIFRDSVAPQFLIALIILVEGAPGSSQTEGTKQEAHDAVRYS